MIIKQAELKSAAIKALVSQDKSVRLIFDVNLTPSNQININELHDFLYKGLILEIKEDGGNTYTET